tara:strand:+ start:89 stop:313 length:225 start_codon:yes stop_codon:yes gene_type:complete
MRVAPSQTTSATNGNFYVTGSGQQQTTGTVTIGTEGLNPNGVTVSVPVSTLTIGQSFWFNTVNANGWIAWEAEL